VASSSERSAVASPPRAPLTASAAALSGLSSWGAGRSANSRSIRASAAADRCCCRSSCCAMARREAPTCPRSACSSGVCATGMDGDPGQQDRDRSRSTWPWPARTPAPSTRVRPCGRRARVQRAHDPLPRPMPAGRRQAFRVAGAPGSTPPGPAPSRGHSVPPGSVRRAWGLALRVHRRAACSALADRCPNKAPRR